MSHRPPMANPYLKMGGAGCARQTYDQYEFVPPKKAQSSRPASAGKPKATQGDHLMAAKAARPQLTAPSAPPPATPPAPSPKYAAPASSRVPRPAQPAAASAALAAVFSVPPAPAPVPVVDPEVHELKEMFNSPARPPPARPERRIPGKTHPPVDYTTAIKAHEQMSAQRAAIRAIADGETSADKIAAANGAWMDRGNMQPARTHTRTVVSRFGEMMEESYALPVPPQPWEQQPPQLSQDSVNKHFELTGGSRSGATNTQKFDSTPSFRSRTAASKQVAAPGVPGYMGHIPHAAMGRGNHSPREDHFVKAPYRALDQSAYPKKMPPPGYGGHLHMTKDSVDSYGTSRWAPKEPQNRSPRVMQGDQYPPTTGWPMCSAGFMVDQADGPQKLNSAEIQARHEKMRASLGNF